MPMPLYQVFVIAIGFAFIASGLRKLGTPANKNKFGELMYTDAERQDETR